MKGRRVRDKVGEGVIGGEKEEEERKEGVEKKNSRGERKREKSV